MYLHFYFWKILKVCKLFEFESLIRSRIFFYDFIWIFTVYRSFNRLNKYDFRSLIQGICIKYFVYHILRQFSFHFRLSTGHVQSYFGPVFGQVRVNRQLSLLWLGILWWFFWFGLVIVEPSAFRPSGCFPVKWLSIISFSIWTVDMCSIYQDVLDLVGHSTKTFGVDTIIFLAITFRNISETPFLKPSSELK